MNSKTKGLEDPIVFTDKFLETLNNAERWDSEQLVGIIQRLPYVIRINADILIDRMYDWEMAKLEEKEVRSELKLESIKLKQSKELTSEGDREAWVDAQSRMRDAKRNTLSKMRDYKKQEAIWEELKNDFFATRKTADVSKDGEATIDRAQIGSFGRRYS